MLACRPPWPGEYRQTGRALTGPPAPDGVRSCRALSLRRPRAGAVEQADAVGMAAIDASLSGSRELSLAAVAYLSRYRGTSREHTESDLRIFIT